MRLERKDTIRVFIPTPLRDTTRGAREIAVSAANLEDLLVALERGWPALHKSICEDHGGVRKHINLFVNRSHMRDRDGLSTRLAPGDVVTIMTAVSGG